MINKKYLYIISILFVSLFIGIRNVKAYDTLTTGNTSTSSYSVVNSSEDYDLLANNGNRKNEDLINKICRDINNNNSDNEESRESNNQLKVVDIKNILRSKINLQRLAKANESEFHTFITLTFEDNIKDIKEANDVFHKWCSQVKRIKKDFKYLGVPEFQKRGAVHYHLMTNLSITKDKDLILKQNNKKFMYDVKYWKVGYSSVYSIRKSHINVVAYLTKYFTKDIDNRLFGKRRYLYSRNLKKPSIVYLNDNSIEDLIKVFDIMDYNKIFESIYKDKFNNDIVFKEYMLKI